MYDSIYIWFRKVSSNFSHLQTNPTVGFTKDEHLLYIPTYSITWNPLTSMQLHNMNSQFLFLLRKGKQPNDDILSSLIDYAFNKSSIQSQLIFLGDDPRLDKKMQYRL